MASSVAKIAVAKKKVARKITVKTGVGREVVKVSADKSIEKSARIITAVNT